MKYKASAVDRVLSSEKTGVDRSILTSSRSVTDRKACGSNSSSLVLPEINDGLIAEVGWGSFDQEQWPEENKKGTGVKLRLKKIDCRTLLRKRTDEIKYRKDLERTAVENSYNELMSYLKGNRRTIGANRPYDRSTEITLKDAKSKNQVTVDPNDYIIDDFDQRSSHQKSYDQNKRLQLENASFKFKLGQLFDFKGINERNQRLSMRAASHQPVYKLPKKAKPAMEHLNDFYEIPGRERPKKKRGGHHRGAGTAGDLDSEDTLAAVQRANTEDFSGMSGDNEDAVEGILNSNKSPNYSNKSIDVPMEGELSLRNSKASILRKSISKIKQQKVPHNSMVDSPLLKLGRAWQSQEGINQDFENLENREHDEDMENKENKNQKTESKMQKLFSKNVGKPSLIRTKSKVYRDVDTESYWMKCINKCLEQKDLMKHNKIGYNETLTTLPAKLSSTEPKSSR